MAVDSGRRRVTAALIAGAGAGVLFPDTFVDRLLAQSACADRGAKGDLLGHLPLFGTQPRATPFGEVVGGAGLDARRFTDLSGLEPGRIVTPSDRVFIRTGYPDSLRSRSGPWAIPITAADGQVLARISADDLAARARPLGAHLIECAGNADPQNFGLMSVAEWDGVPLADVLPAPGGSDAAGVLVGGVDDAQESLRSVPGASWIFPMPGLREVGPFLAVRMNGAALPADHGAPVRLVVPGWYGCSWIKWVNEIRFVGAGEPSTTQMREFARRTHQDGVPALARDYAPPAIEVAATPIRIEKRRVNGRLEYRILGIVWGGSTPTEQLLIRFGSRDAWKPLTVCPAPATHRTWSVWEYWWRPEEPGTYDIALKPADATVPARRLDVFYYIRRTRVDDV